MLSSNDKGKLGIIGSIIMIIGTLLIGMLLLEKFSIGPRYLDLYDHEMQMTTCEILSIRSEDDETYAVFEIENFRMVQHIEVSSKLVKGDLATIIYYENDNGALVSAGAYFSIEEALEELARIEKTVAKYKD